MKSFNLRGTKRQPPAPTATSPQNPVTQGVPLAPGTFVKMDASGNPVPAQAPPDLADRIAQARFSAMRRDEEEAQQAVDELVRSERKLQMPITHDLRSLPPEKQQELAAAVKAAPTVDWEKVNREQEARLLQLPPAMRDTLLQSVGHTLDMRRAQAAESAPASAPAASPTAAAAKTDESKTHCQHCLWPLEVPEPSVEPTAQDKLLFIAASTGGPPLLKEYRLLGGHLCVVFRQLKAVHDQIVADQVRLAPPDQAPAAYAAYRLLFGLDRLNFGADSFQVAKDVDEVIAEYSTQELREKPVLQDLLNRMLASDQLATESVWRMLLSTFQKFCQLINVLEARRDDEAFWRGIQS